MRKLFLLFLIALCISAKGQNLVLNSGFEEFSKERNDTSCPFPLSPFAVNWCSYNTADYYNAAYDEKGILENCEPHSGTGCAGICFLKDANSPNYREYVVAMLSKPLTEGKKYKFEMYYKYQSGGFASNGLGVYLTSELSLPTRGLFAYHPQINSFADSVLFDKNGWSNVTEDYTAQGGEQYMIIGNFKPDNAVMVRKKELNGGFRHNSYYLLDDVSLIPFEDTIPAAVEPQLYEPQKKYVLKFVYFDTDKSILLPQSYTELDKLVAYLKEKPGIKIEIGGHTDNAGSYEHNITLSGERAEAVVAYLISQGIQADRLSYKGYGPNQPMAPNDTAENMQLNRRVDFMILE